MKIICCVTNKPYVVYTIQFLESLYKHNPNINVKLLSIDCDKEQIDSINAISSNIEIEELYLNLDLTKKFPRYVDKLKQHKYCNDHEISGFYNRSCANSVLDRFSLLSESAIQCMMYKYIHARKWLDRSDVVMLMDVDCLIRGDISKMFLFGRQHDLTCKQQIVQSYQYIIFHEGISILKQNKKTKLFLDRVIEAYRSFGIVDKIVDADQLIYRQEYYEQSIGIDFFPLPDKYKDSEFFEDSLVWSGVGDNKKKLDVYT